MKHSSIIFILVAALLSASSCGSRTESLFNGKDFEGWTQYTDTTSVPVQEPTFSVKDGAISVTGKPFGYIRTNKKYSDFTLTLEWRWSGGERVDSGIYTSIKDGDRIWPAAIQCQLKDGDLGLLIAGIEISGGEKKGGATFKQPLTAEKVEKEVGQWNKTEIESTGGHYKVLINGVLLNETDVKEPEGYIGLQSEGGAIEFRNISIRRK